jgi:hypothetical protein
MKIVEKAFHFGSRKDLFTLVPLGDIHIGARACDEERLERVVARIAADPDCMWVGMGDYCEFINRNDPRFEPRALADWIKMSDLTDLARAQKNRFLEIVEPIAPKCVALLEGNHEASITRFTERSIYREIVTEVKRMAGLPEDEKLGLGYYGWIRLRFVRMTKAVHYIHINAHHGFTGGRLAGAKALNMQRWLWTHDADLALMGHSHNTGMQVEAIESLNRQTGEVSYVNRVGAYTGTFLKSGVEGALTYSEVKGYLPMPVSGIEVVLKPGTHLPMDKIKIITSPL